MKLLLFSDLHCNTNFAQEILTQSGQVDVVIGAGDFASVRRGIEKTIDILKEIKKPSILVPGNNESLEELYTACKGWAHAHILHGSALEIEGETFFGIGGGIPITPFGSWSYDFSEEDAEKLLSDLPEGTILISHSPPYGVLDVSSGGQHFGSKSVRDTIINKKPKLVVCGHVHESGGKKANLEKSIVINAGPEGILYELN